MIGVDLCACQPGSWEFTIDFSLSCDDTTFPEEITASRPGIVGSFCQAILLVPVGDPIYASIDSTTIVELDQDGAAISQQSIGPLNDGDTFTYVSVLDAIPSFNSTTLPRSIVVSFTGMNAEGSPLNVLWLVEFNNDCQVFIDDENAFPVVVPGDQSASTLVVCDMRIILEHQALLLFVSHSQLISFCFLLPAVGCHRPTCLSLPSRRI